MTHTDINVIENQETPDDLIEQMKSCSVGPTTTTTVCAIDTTATAITTTITESDDVDKCDVINGGVNGDVNDDVKCDVKCDVVNGDDVKCENDKDEKDESSNVTDCTCGELPAPKKDRKTSKISMSYAKLKKRKQKSRKNIDKKNKLLLAKIEDSSLPPQQESWLLRLFESKLFDMPIALSYLFNSKESGVLAYLGNKLFVSIICHSQNNWYLGIQKITTF